VPVIEIETALLKVGQQVEAKVDALGGAIVKGTISRIAYARSATRTMLVEADFKNDDGKLRPGMFATDASPSSSTTTPRSSPSPAS
jgi:membrane fusion protein (multidrug efflux system)